MKLHSLEYKVVQLHSPALGAVEVTVSSDETTLVFQIIKTPSKPVALSHHIIDAIEDGAMDIAHELQSLFLSIYYLNKEEIDDFLRSKDEARKLPV